METCFHSVDLNRLCDCNLTELCLKAKVPPSLDHQHRLGIHMCSPGRAPWGLEHIQVEACETRVHFKAFEIYQRTLNDLPERTRR